MILVSVADGSRQLTRIVEWRPCQCAGSLAQIVKRRRCSCRCTAQGRVAGQLAGGLLLFCFAL